MSIKQDKTQHQVSLKRPDGFYTADNELVEVFAPEIGIYAFGVYHLLKQRAFKREEERGISLLGISRGLAISKESAGAAIATLCQVGLVEMHPSLAVNKPPRYEVVHAKDVLEARPEYRTREYPQLPQEQAKSRTRVKTHSRRNVGRAVGEIQDAGRRNVGRQQAKSRTPNKEEELKKEEYKQDRYPPTPQGGWNEPKRQKRETKNPKATADGVVRRRAGVEPADHGGELGGGLSSRLAGSVDALELGGQPPADRPATRQTAAAARPEPGMTAVREVLGTLARDLGLDPPDPPDRANPREQATWFLQKLRNQFATGFLLAQRRGSDWEDPYTAWKRCFDHVTVGEVEADGEQWVVVLETAQPRDLADGLVKYRAKVQLAMRQAFGREVQLVPRLEAL